MNDDDYTVVECICGNSFVVKARDLLRRPSMQFIECTGPGRTKCDMKFDTKTILDAIRRGDASVRVEQIAANFNDQQQ